MAMPLACRNEMLPLGAPAQAVIVAWLLLGQAAAFLGT